MIKIETQGMVKQLKLKMEIGSIIAAQSVAVYAGSVTLPSQKRTDHKFMRSESFG